MKLKSCLKTAYVCGLDTIGEAYNNILFHNVFVYEEREKEIQELIDEIQAKEIRFSELVVDHLSVKDREKIDKEMNDWASGGTITGRSETGKLVGE